MMNRFIFVDNSLKILTILLCAFCLAFLASCSGFARGCELWRVTDGLFLPKTGLGITCLLLCGYASWLTFKTMNQATSITRYLEGQSLLRRFVQAFDNNLSTEEFTLVATRVLSEFGLYFRADALRVEIIEPRTGVTVEEYLGTQYPPPISPEIKAAFLKRIDSSRLAEDQASGYFVDITKVHFKSFKACKTNEVAAAVITPLGRIAIMLLTFQKPRRSFRQDEISLLCSSLLGLMQTASDHCKRRNREDLERRLRHAERVQAVGTLAGGIAHEFNNILGALLGYGEMALQSAQEGGQVEHYVGEMMSTAKRAEYIVSQILTLSRNREQERRPINLIEAIQDALPLITASLPQLEVRANLVSDEDCKLFGHPVELQQVIMNLCKNALEASRGEIRVDLNVNIVVIESVRSLFLGLLQPGKYVRLCIADNGTGIPPDKLPHIFEPFFTTKIATGGTGLGLAAVHGLVTAMDGRIDVTSEWTKGASFDVYFPHSTLPAIPINQLFSSQKVVLGTGELIALLKPDTRDLAMQEEKIAALGYEPVGFLDIGTMEEWLSTQTPDLIIIDTRSIPLRYSACDIAAMARGAPIVLISHIGNEEMLSAAIALRFNVLREPLSTSALANGIRKAFQGVNGTGIGQGRSSPLYRSVSP